MALSRSTMLGSNQISRLALLVGCVLVAHAAERKRLGDRVERGLRDRDADHAASAEAVIIIIIGADIMPFGAWA